MPLSLFIGAGGISLSPLIALFVIFIAPSYVRIIFWIVGGFCWLLSLFATSIVWFIWYGATKGNPELNDDLKFGALMGVIIQEGMRFIGLMGLRKIVKLLETRPVARGGGDSFDMSGSTGYFVTGLGFGSLATLFHMMNILAASLGPGSPGLEIEGIENANQNLYFTSAFFSSAMTLNHCAWTVICGASIELGNSKKSKLLIVYIVVAHLLCTGTTLLNNSGLIWPAMTTTWISVVASGLLALSESGFKNNSSNQVYQLVNTRRNSFSSSGSEGTRHPLVKERTHTKTIL